MVRTCSSTWSKASASSLSTAITPIRAERAIMGAASWLAGAEQPGEVDL